MAKAPIVIVTTDTVFHRHMNWSGSPATYCEALAQVGVVPLQLPTTTTPYDVDALLDIASGVLLTGARSNVHPERYGVAPTEAAAPHDLADPSKRGRRGLLIESVGKVGRGHIGKSHNRAR